MKTACKRMITQQVSEILRIEIEDGDLYPGTKIPTDTGSFHISAPYFLVTMLQNTLMFLLHLLHLFPLPLL